MEDKEILLRYEELLSHYKNPPSFIMDRNTNAYSPSTDTIKYVPLNRWDNASDFVSTLLHEVVHSTGHTSRLNRPYLVNPFPFGSLEYCKEEIVAELGAAFLCQHIGIFPKQVENTAAYLQAWISILQNDDKFIFRAAAKAQKAVDFVFGESKNNKPNL